MSDENIYYVYAHYKPEDATPFYIGKGSGRRLWDKQNRSEWWINIVNKYGFVAKKLIENLTHEDALKEEAKLIREYGRMDLGTGCLINLTDGMDGNAKLSEQTKQKMSESAKGRKWSQQQKDKFSKIKKQQLAKYNPSIGRKHSDITKRKIGEKSKQKVFTDDYRKKLSRVTSGRNNPRATVYKIEEKIFYTKSEAEKYFNMCFATIQKRFSVINLGRLRLLNLDNKE